MRIDNIPNVEKKISFVNFLSRFSDVYNCFFVCFIRKSTTRLRAQNVGQRNMPLHNICAQ